tara:strand:+ start:8744 stop:9619 length:876 start_codon:yes stop_codon:yes gene_type:complete
MENFYDIVVNTAHFKKIELDEITIVEYICPIQVPLLPVWTPHDYVVHVLSGKKTWKTSLGSTTLQKCDTAYIKKGGHIVEQDFTENFCLLVFFLKDEFKSMLSVEVLYDVINKQNFPSDNILYKLSNNPSIIGYFESVFSYFQMLPTPSEHILRLKFQELVHVLASEKYNHDAIGQIISSNHHTLTNLKKIMIENYIYNLSLDDFAKLCNRSLSSFKRDFKQCFHTSPGKWLTETRIKQASSLLANTNNPITQVAFECGFENLSHFSKLFKLKMNITPKEYRKKFNLNQTE